MLPLLALLLGLVLLHQELAIMALLLICRHCCKEIKVEKVRTSCIYTHFPIYGQGLCKTPLWSGPPGLSNMLGGVGCPIGMV